MKRLLLPAVSMLLAAGAHASAFYRCVDANGATLYTNQKSSSKNCTVLSVMVPPGGAKAAGGSGGAAVRTPSPADFPRVGQGEQQARDNDRRSILNTELGNERLLLDQARQLGKADAVALHERNIEALNKEIAKLR